MKRIFERWLREYLGERGLRCYRSWKCAELEGTVLQSSAPDLIILGCQYAGAPMA